MAKTKDIKEVNNKKNEEYKEKARLYEAEADDFKKRWKEEHATRPSEEETNLMKLLQEARLQEKATEATTNDAQQYDREG